MTEDRPTISTHVLDTGTGEPAAGVPVAALALDARRSRGGRRRGDHRCRRADPRPARRRPARRPAPTGSSSGSTTAASSPACRSDVRIEDPSRSYHVPLLRAPFGLSTYRGLVVGDRRTGRRGRRSPRSTRVRAEACATALGTAVRGGAAVPRPRSAPSDRSATRVTLFAIARRIARTMPESEQLELIDAHPRLGAPASVFGAVVRRAGLRAGRGRPAAADCRDRTGSRSPPSSTG